jgi:hypothetical protein
MGRVHNFFVVAVRQVLEEMKSQLTNRQAELETVRITKSFAFCGSAVLPLARSRNETSVREYLEGGRGGLVLSFIKQWIYERALHVLNEALGDEDEAQTLELERVFKHIYKKGHIPYIFLDSGSLKSTF